MQGGFRVLRMDAWRCGTAERQGGARQSNRRPLRAAYSPCNFPGRIREFEKPGLEGEADLARHGSRSHVVRAAERRQEVVESIFIREVNDRDASAPFVTVPVKEIVV